LPAVIVVFRLLIHELVCAKRNYVELLSDAGHVYRMLMTMVDIELLSFPMTATIAHGEIVRHSQIIFSFHTFT